MVCEPSGSSVRSSNLNHNCPRLPAPKLSIPPESPNFSRQSQSGGYRSIASPLAAACRMPLSQQWAAQAANQRRRQLIVATRAVQEKNRTRPATAAITATTATAGEKNGREEAAFPSGRSVSSKKPSAIWRGNVSGLPRVRAPKALLFARRRCLPIELGREKFVYQFLVKGQ